MAFQNPFFLLGAAALAAPILVHLVRRTRARRVQFPALVFVRQVPQRTIRRRTLHNLLLLALRCLAILLIVIAFTRPFFSGGSAARDNTAAGATVILVDNSLSMRRENLFAEAQKRAESALDEARNDEQIALVSFDKRYTVINRFLMDKNRVRSGISSLAAGWDGTDYEQALRGAESLLSEVETTGPKRIVLISDFQAPGWSPATATFKLSSNTQLQTLDVGGKNPPPNVAITNVEARGVVFGQKYLDNVVVHVSNFGDSVRDHLEVDFLINDQTVEKRDISLNSRDSRVIEFTGFNLNEGTNRCTIEIFSGDFAPDNRFYFTLRRETPSKALIIDLRNNGGGEDELGQLLLSYLIDQPFKYYDDLIINARSFDFSKYTGNPVNVPEKMVEARADGKFHAVSHPNWGIKQPNQPTFSGKVYILINGGSFSTTSEFLSQAHFHKRATFIGQESAGGYYGNSSGMVPLVTLPNTKVQIRVPLVTYYMAVSGYKAAAHGVVPDINIDYTIEELLAGTDKEMDAALKLARKN